MILSYRERKETVMERVEFIEYKGKKILKIDMSNCLENEVFSVIEQAKKVIFTQPQNSLLTLTDVTHARYNASVVAAMQVFTKENKRYVRAAAVVGINSIKRIIFNKIMEAAERELNAFENAEKAKEWLVSV